VDIEVRRLWQRCATCVYPGALELCDGTDNDCSYNAPAFDAKFTTCINSLGGAAYIIPLFICAALVAGEGVLPESDASDLLDTGNVCTQNFCLGGEIFELMLVANPCDPPGSDLDDCVDDYCSDDAECVGHLRPGYAACSVDADSAPTDAVLCGPDPDTGTSRCQGRCNSVGTCWACVPEVCDGLDNDCDGDGCGSFGTTVMMARPRGEGALAAGARAA
jgi:hypothetical protein